MRAALINKQTGEVDNIIELPDDYDPEIEGSYLPPEDLRIIKDPDNKAVTGGSYDQGIWTDPEPSEPTPEPEPTVDPVVEERLLALEAEVRGMKERAAAAEVAAGTDAAKVRDAVVGPPE